MKRRPLIAPAIIAVWFSSLVSVGDATAEDASAAEPAGRKVSATVLAPAPNVQDVEHYFLQKTQLAARFKEPKESEDEAHSEALSSLLAVMTIIVRPPNSSDLPGSQRLSPGTLRSEWGLCQMDGIVIEDKPYKFFLSTELVLQRYLSSECAKWNTLSSQIVGLVDNMQTYLLTITEDRAVNIMFDLPVASDGRYYTKAFAAETSMDTPQYGPTHIYVLVRSNGRLLIAQEEIDNSKNQIVACNKRRETANHERGQVAERAKLEATAVTAFLTCYREQASKQKFFRALTSRSKSLAKRLHSIALKS